MPVILALMQHLLVGSTNTKVSTRSTENNISNKKKICPSLQMCDYPQKRQENGAVLALPQHVMCKAPWGISQPALVPSIDPDCEMPKNRSHRKCALSMKSTRLHGRGCLFVCLN